MKHSHSIPLAGITSAKVDEAFAHANRKCAEMAAHERVKEPSFKESMFVKAGADMIPVEDWRSALGKGTHLVCVVEVDNA